MYLYNNAAIETVYARIQRQNIRQLALCSTQHEAGNSSIAWALAKRAAQSGKRVLLIELNRCSPIFAQQQSHASPEWLPLTGHWEHAAQESEQAGLMLLCSPEKTGHCVEFRDQETLRLFFQSCLGQFDMVICDTEPLISSGKINEAFESGDNLPVDIICAASETTLLNVVTGQTTESQVDEARDILHQSGAQLCGVIMNDQHAPGLKQELIRETYRFNRVFPKLMQRLRARLDKMVLLNQEL
ncbi:CpsD/CapB family tyrosine-protein kinase [Neptunomonas sp. XY-337]|uniref:CpsD/CapB family tyrosine-protein kinase n=1 Tax=Neptunomonas sp. XY-337 TaxID=2561897 RepID=UPI0010A9D9A3|nr:CpsD/CapB family tyrosine-protein kinase [Neptunomonas sp. XY-337]